MPGVCFSDILRQKDGGKWKRSFKVPEIIQDIAVNGFGEMRFVFPESAQRHICSMRQFKSAEHRIAFEEKVLGCNGIYNSFSLGPKITFDTMPFGFENHLIFGSINFRQDHMEKAIRMLAQSPYDRIVELISRDEFAADPIGAYENRIYCKNAPMKTAVIWNQDKINMEG